MTINTKQIIKKISNLMLESKLLLSTICINILFMLLFLFAAYSLVTSRYDKLLYQSMQSSSALVSHEFLNRMDEMITMSNIVRTDTNVQSLLDEITNPVENHGTQYYSEIYNTLQTHYAEYKHSYLTFAAISCPKFIAYTYGNRSDRLSEERAADLVKIAEAADGSPVWVADYATEEGLYLVREIKKIENLSLDNLGTFIIKINFDKLIKEVSKVSKDYEDSYWMISQNGTMIYASPELSEAALARINDTINNYGVLTVNGRKYFAIRGTMRNNNWDYIQMVSYDEVAKSQTVTLHLYLLILFAGFISSFLLMHIVVRKVTKHFDVLILRMKEFGKHSEILPQTTCDYFERTDEIGMLHQQFENMAKEIQTLVIENYKQQLLTKDAQLKSLESQMNPHFLYNTLDTINWRAKAGGEPQISQIAESLGHFLRITLNKSGDNFTLHEELDIIQYYMTIQQLRFDNRLNFTMNVAEAYYDATIPKLSLQPLLENAVHYALEQITDDCDIQLTCTKPDTNLHIYVKNSGSEFPEELLQKLKNHEIKEKGLGIALINIQERIQLMFGEEYGLHFYNEDDYAVVKMIIPYIPAKRES